MCVCVCVCRTWCVGIVEVCMCARLVLFCLICLNFFLFNFIIAFVFAFVFVFELVDSYRDCTGVCGLLVFFCFVQAGVSLAFSFLAFAVACCVLLLSFLFFILFLFL